MSFGGGRTVTNETTQEPWDAAQPYILGGMDAAQNLVNSGIGQQYFPGSTVVPFSPQTETALQAMEGRAMQGSPLGGAATNSLSSIMKGQSPAADYWKSVIGGDYLNSNPYLDQTFNRMADQVQGRVDAAAGRMGRTDSGAHYNVLADSLGDLSNQVYGQNYQLERDRQQQAASGYDQFTGRQLQSAALAPSINAMDYYDIDRLLQAGQAREGLGQAYMEDLINRWNFSQQAPWNVLNQYNSIASGIASLGAQGQASQPTSWGQRIGNALSGAGVGVYSGKDQGGSGLGLGILGGLAGLFI